MYPLPISVHDLDAIILDHRVGEQLLGRLLEGGFGAALVRGRDLDVEHLAMPHAGDADDAERLERALDRLALRIEDAGLEGDGDARFHGCLTGSIFRRRRPIAPASGRSPPRVDSHRPAAPPTPARRACWRRPECRGALRAAWRPRGSATRRRRSAGPRR